MATTLDRFKEDLKALIEQARLLTGAMQMEVFGEGVFYKNIKDADEKDKVKKFISKLPDFRREYEAWYSESLAVVRQLLPDRLENFVSFYEKPKNRKEITSENYTIQDYMQGIQVKFRGEVTVDHSAALSQFQQQRAILIATNRRFESSLFDIKQIVQADLFDSELAAARELLKKKFLRASGAIAGVLLEKHLRVVCENHKITISKKHPSINDFNEILKSSSVIGVVEWRHISLLGDIRNICDHNKSLEPTADQVADLINGTEKIMKTVI